MPRTSRVKNISGIYHIMLRGIDRQLIVEDEEDKKKLSEVLRQCKEICGFELYAYCLLGNHFHLLLKVGNESLEQIFKRFGARYVYYFNQKYKRVGHLFQDRFKSEPINDDTYLLKVLSYIHNNPIKAGLNKTAAEYKWSSYNDYMGSPSLADVNFVWGMITKIQFVDLHKQTHPEELLESKKKSFGVTDTEAICMVKKVCGIESREFTGMDIAQRNSYIRILRGQGISIRQLSRVTGISKGSIERIR